VYNHEKYLRESIESILSQKVDFNYEIVIADDMSTDSSQEIINYYFGKHADLIRPVLRSENIGASKNYYEACVSAKGKYIASLEGDDYWCDDYKLQKMVDFLEGNNSYIGVSHVIEGLDIHGNTERHPVIKDALAAEISIKELLRGKRFSIIATVYRNIYKDKNYSAIFTAHRQVADYIIAVILLDLGKIWIINEVMSVYRVRNMPGESNYNSITDFMTKAQDHISLICNIARYYDKYNFTGELVRYSLPAFFSSIRRNLLSDYFDRVFRLLPGKVKIQFFLCLPYYVLKTLMCSIQGSEKRNKTKKDSL